MKLKHFIKNTIRECLNEQVGRTNNIRNILIKRIPFLKEYEIYTNPRDKRRLEAKRIVYNENVPIIMGDDILIFPQYNASSEIIYYPHQINDITFHHFNIKNKFHMVQPKEKMDNLSFRVFLAVTTELEKKLSYRKEVILSHNEDITENELNEIINEMNGNLFKFEEYTKKINIDFF